MQDKLIARAKELLAEGKVQKVVGWKKGLLKMILLLQYSTLQKNSTKTLYSTSSVRLTFQSIL